MGRRLVPARATSTTARRSGPSQNEECRLDSLTQSWAVLSGAANAERAERAMDAVRAHLVRRDAQIVLLLTPPFDRMAHDPGYIKGYLPGVRENGGQYTHAALWTVIALARLGLGDEAMELFHMINPDQPHRARPKALERYRAEPYVVAADVYAHPMHVGRGGWTWYTGSAGWMYQAAVGNLLGLQRQGDTFKVESVHPRDVARVLARLATRRVELSHRSAESRTPVPRRTIRGTRWRQRRPSRHPAPRRRPTPRGHRRAWRCRGRGSLGRRCGKERTNQLRSRVHPPDQPAVRWSKQHGAGARLVGDLFS